MNEFFHAGSVSYIRLTAGKVAIVDRSMIGYLAKWTWYAFKAKFKWYARTTVHSKKRSYHISMHRLIAKTPSGQICHHKNHNSLDNRRNNLENVTRKWHETYHRLNTIRWKYIDENPFECAKIPAKNPEHPP